MSFKPPLRFDEPRKHGTMFCYRKLDVLRVVAIAKTISKKPRIVDVGCGNGDFTEKLLEYVPDVTGIDNDPKFNNKPFIKCVDINDVHEEFDLAFLGWMEIGKDYRDATSKLAPVIVSVWERGGCCGIDDDAKSCCQEFDEFGLENIAQWRTPAWMDIHVRLALSHIGSKREAIWYHDVGSVWDVWTKPEVSETVTEALANYVIDERTLDIVPYEFEKYLDKTGYTLWRRIRSLSGVSNFRLWEVKFFRK